LPRYQPEPSGELAARSERFRIEPGGGQRGGGDNPDSGDAFEPLAGNTHDVIMAPALVAAIAAVARLLADKAYDTNPFRAVLAERHIEPVIPSTRRRKLLIPYDATAYPQRNLIERMFARLKDFRRVSL
jgi:transposase